MTRPDGASGEVLTEQRLVRIPRALLHVQFDDLPRLGLTEQSRQELRRLLADLPLVPDATFSTQLIGPPDVALTGLAVVARHVGQGLRDTNLAIAHDRARLQTERLKLIFLTAAEVDGALLGSDQRLAHESALFLSDVAPTGMERVRAVLRTRELAGLVSIVSAPAPLTDFSHWRICGVGRSHGPESPGDGSWLG